MTDRVIVITGASDGIGAAAAAQLRTEGETVVVVGRSPARTERVARDLDAPYYLADFSNFDDVHRLAAHLRADLPRIDVLANNAGGLMGPRMITVDGNERTTQVNHLAPFLLTQLLMETLVASRARVITTSSSAHRRARAIDLDDLTLERGYRAFDAYARAKLMNILFTRELDRRWRARGLASAAFHPGVVRTSFASEFPSSVSGAYTSATRWLFRSPARGADTLVWLATTPGEAWTSGGYYKDRRVGRASRLAQRDDLAQELWERSTALTGLS
jgi:NAD(P)-dependent dehydrogenase (short-subunit alcohol dehydrogenase family)